MSKSKRSIQPVKLLTGKYGILLLTALNVCLACLIITLCRYWGCLNFFNTQTNTDYMTYYLPDYRIGFIPRALIGSILYLFTKHPTLRMVKTILYITTFSSTLLFCWFQAILAKKALRSSDYATLLLSYLFFLNSIFWEDAYMEFGLLDIFMTLLLQLFLIVAERKRSRAFWLAPIVCLIGLCIHNAFFLSCLPVVAAILWYEMLRSGKVNRVCLLILAITCIASIALFVFFVFFPQTVVRVNPEELNEMFRQKYDGQIRIKNFIYYLYRSDAEKSAETISASDYLTVASSKIDFFSSKILVNLLNILPLTVPFIYGCVYHARRSSERLIAYLAFLAPLVALFPSLGFSTDKERFFSLFIVAQYMLLHYIVMRSDDRFLPGADDPPRKKLSRYAAERRSEKIRRTLTVCTIAGAIYTFAATRFI